MATAAPKIDLAQIAANMRQINPNLQQTAAPAPPSYSGTTSGYQPSTPAPAYNGTTSNYKPPQASNPVAAPPQTAAPKPQPQGTPMQAQKVPGGWMTADGQFVPVPNAGGTPAPPRPQEPPNYQFQPMPQTATTAPQMQQPTAAPVYKDPYARTPESIAALAKERVQKILQAGKTSAQGALTGAKNAYDYTNQIEGDTRTLRNAQFKETSNPFSGNTGYQAANMQRNDSIQDTSQDKDYNAQVGLINQKLADLEAAAPGDEQAIIDQLQQIERQTGISVAQLQEQQRQNQFNNNMQTNQFNRGVYESDRGFNYGAGQDAIQNNRADRQLTGQEQNQSFNQGMQNRQFEYGAGQDQIQNNRADRQLTNQEREQAFNQSQATKQQHIDLADRLSQQYGVQVYPTDDPMESYAQVAGLSSVVAQKLAEDMKQQGFENTIKAALANNTITQTQAGILHEAQQISISQQNANTSASSANTSRQNMESDNAYRERAFQADQAQRAIDNKYRESQNKTDKMTAEEYDKNLKPQVDNYGKLTNAQQMEDQILLSGLSDYEQYKLYIKHGIPWTDPIPTK